MQTVLNQAVSNRAMARLGWQGRFQPSLPYPSYVGWHVILDAWPNPALRRPTAASPTVVHSI